MKVSEVVAALSDLPNDAQVAGSLTVLHDDGRKETMAFSFDSVVAVGPVRSRGYQSSRRVPTAEQRQLYLAGKSGCRPSPANGVVYECGRPGCVRAHYGPDSAAACPFNLYPVDSSDAAELRRVRRATIRALRDNGLSYAAVGRLVGLGGGRVKDIVSEAIREHEAEVEATTASVRILGQMPMAIEYLRAIAGHAVN